MNRWLIGAALVVGVSSAFGQEYVVPISGLSPQVVVSLTDERDSDDFEFSASISDYNDTSNRNKTSPIRVLPTNGAPHYDFFIFDTGAPAHILSYESTAKYDIALAGRRGTNITLIGGAGGEFLEATNSDPLAIYTAGFGAINSTSPLGVDTTQFRGQYNVSVINGEFNTENPDLDLPNLIGTPIASQYTTVIRNSDPYIIEHEDALRRSPDLELLDVGSLDREPRRLGMRFDSGSQVLPAPVFVPNLSGISLDDPGDNPSSPTNTGWYFVDADVRNNGRERTNLEFLVDTGAQATIVSEQEAVKLGFDVELDEPDFVVRIQGVTGVSEEVPGFIADEFHLLGTAGGLKLKDVPLVVFNLRDPRKTVGTLPALLGMNVFVDRDVILNPEAEDPYVGVSDPIGATRSWASSQAIDSWNSATSWNGPGSPEIDWFAYIQNVTGTPQTAVLSQDTTMSALTTKGHESDPRGTMTVAVENSTLTLYGSAILQQGSTLHLDDARLSPLAVELRGGALRGNGTVEGEVLSQGILQPGGIHTIGQLVFTGSLDQLSQGDLQIDLRDFNTFDQIQVEGTMTVGGQLSLQTTSDHVAPAHGESQTFPIIDADGDLFGSFTSYEFSGRPIGVDCQLDDSTQCRTLSATEFREHIGNGQFIEIDYRPGGVSIIEYRALQGDTNGDGDVAFDDFLRVASSFGGSGDWRSGDFSGDGTVNFGDFLSLSSNFDGEAQAAHAVVPEPTSLLPILSVAFALRRRRRTR